MSQRESTHDWVWMGAWEGEGEGGGWGEPGTEEPRAGESARIPAP